MLVFQADPLDLNVSIFFCFGLTVHRECENQELSGCSMITWIMHWIISIGSFIACLKKCLKALLTISQFLIGSLIACLKKC